jgi:cardiolipin synthase
MPGKNRKHINSYTQQNRVRFVRGGTAYFRLLEKMIDNARHSVHLQTYIFDDDKTGTRIGEALMRTAKKGIPVYFIADGYASQNIAKNYIHKLRESGIQFRYFEPLFRSHYFYVGRRMHHKVAVIDAKYALVGGVNIADRYNDFPGSPAWMDAALYVEGEAAIELFNLCNSFWSSHVATIISLPQDINDFLQSIPEAEYCSVRIRRNDWLKRRTEIWRTYFNLINHATESITIMCSYFLPGRRLRKALANAAQRGIKIRVILAGLSDVMVAKWAERYLYNWMFQSGIEVYEYQPSILHAKLAMVDRHWVTVGSYNVNNISTYASIELNADIRNKPLASVVAKELDTIIAKDCVRITAEQFKLKLSFLNKLAQKLSYRFIDFVLYLFTFYFKHEE